MTQLDDGQGESPGTTGGFWASLFAWRWLVLAFLMLLVLLVLVRGATPVAALVVAAAVILLVGVGGRSSQGIQPAPDGALTSATIDNGMTGFADLLAVPAFLLDRQGIVLHANPHAFSVLRLRPGDSLIARFRAPEFLAAFNRVAAGGEAERVDYAERLLPGRSFAAWLAPLPSPDAGRPRGIALILDDLTELRRSERVRADFVANASHELRTPLASLAGFIETLLGPARDDAAARERFLGVMHEQATRMRRLIDDLLSLSRVEMAPRIREGEEVDLTQVLRHVADALAPLARDNGVTLETDIPAEPVIVPGDRDELVQLVDNLVENACRYGAAGKRVVLALEVPSSGGGECVVSVRDFGPGISPEHLPRLTERFYRVDVEASRRHRGTGLGLAIVKHIINRHGARLSIESRPGEGARFAVHFPRWRQAAPAVPGADALTAPAKTASPG